MPRKNSGLSFKYGSSNQLSNENVYLMDIITVGQYAYTPTELITCYIKKFIKKAQIFILYLSVIEAKTKLGIMQKTRLKAEYQNLLRRASNEKAQKVKLLSLTIISNAIHCFANQFDLCCSSSAKAIMNR